MQSAHKWRAARRIVRFEISVTPDELAKLIRPTWLVQGVHSRMWDERYLLQLSLTIVKLVTAM
jgi:hypothetical protein